MNNDTMNNGNVKTNNSNLKNYYPASITILLNTRILGHSKTIYSPNMTLPSISIKTIYFNPLIKLDKRQVSLLCLNLQELRYEMK